MYPKEYVDYLVHFHSSRDYFECHEILEEYWKRVDVKNKSSILVAFILLAVSCYHHRRSNFNGAYKTIRKAKKIFTENQHLIFNYGIDVKKLFPLIESIEKKIHEGKPYESVSLPIHDDKLIHLCKVRSEQLHFVWNRSSDLSDPHLIHRHKMRDRTDVILERKKALEQRKGKGLSQ